MSALIPETVPDRQTPNEYTEVEYPLLTQLTGMGWDFQEGDIDYPAKTFREHFREVLLRPKLSEAIRRINRDPHGNEYLDDVTIERAIRELERADSADLIERNREMTGKLVRGVRVGWAEKPAWAREDEVRIKFFDFEHADRNSFLAINQFRVEFVGRTGFVIPDVVLFVNGIPLVVVECKSPAIVEPMNEGINQLLRYANQRPEVAGDEGVPHLFHSNLAMISTWFYEARVAALGADYEYYQEWKDTAPLPQEDVAAQLGKPVGQLKSQEVLTAGMLTPAHLLDILQNFVLFAEDNGKKIKIIPRYQQYRAVHKTLHRLAHGQTRVDTGDLDERGGVIWHTQGSGKSITMVFLVRKLRTTKGLKDFKIVLVTDRTQLEKQLRETMGMAGENLRPNQQDRKRLESPTERVQRILREEGPDLVFCMVQKNQDLDAEYDTLSIEIPDNRRMVADHGPHPDCDGRVTPDAERIGLEPNGHGTEGGAKNGIPYPETRKTRKMELRVAKAIEFPVLNTSTRILLLVDEGHRTEAGMLHANLMTGLPNAAKVAFTGTPIMQHERANTYRIFGPLIDHYGMAQSVADEATVRILYEGRIPEGLIERALDLDQAARIRFREYSDADIQIIMGLYATQRHVLEAPKLIAVKAEDMLRHYVANILPEGFKAQLVATSRIAAVRYQAELQASKERLVAAIEGLGAEVLALPETEQATLCEETQYLLGVRKHLDLIKTLEFAAVISGNHNDDPAWKAWSDPDRRDDYERRFKLPLAHENPEKCSGLAFLCVQNMLLTGFDAPVEQVIYLDRFIQDHSLLQAIARVNRKKFGKTVGYVVDYIGIGRVLKEALLEAEAGRHEGQELDSKRDEVPRLEDFHRQVMSVFTDRGITDIADVEACVDLLADAQIRAGFINKLRRFLISLGIVLPLPEGKRYLRDAKILGFIAKVAGNLYRDPGLNLVGVERRVRELIDEYITAQGVDPRIPPTDIMDANFEEKLAQRKTAKSRASEMLHAIRYHITIHVNEDPEHYVTLREKLEAILQQLRENWAELERVLREFIEKEVRSGRQDAVAGLNPRVQAPFFDLLKREAEEQAGNTLAADGDGFREVLALTMRLVIHIQGEIRKVDFWRDGASRQALETHVYRELGWCKVSGQKLFKKSVRELAQRVVDLARHRHRFLVE